MSQKLNQKLSYKNFATKAIRVGQDPESKTGAVIPPIFQTSTYVQPSPGQHLGYDYTRCTNPTRVSLEQCLASLEEAEYAITCASGLGAVTTVLNLFKSGANIICGNDVYGGVYRLLATIFEDRFNVKWVDTTEIANLENACKEFGKVDLIWVEATSNPLLRVTDIEKVAQIGQKHGAITAVDSTFLTPYLQKPLDFGIDLVVHSVTKYLNGHSDVIAGAVLTNSNALYDKLFYVQKTLGPSLSPFDAWLVVRGIKTLDIRLEKHQDNAIAVANFLKTHPKVEKVLYCGLDEHKNVATLRRQTTDKFRGGGIVSFYIKGGLEAAKEFLENTRIFQLAESLGGVESLSCLPALMTHGSIPKTVREANGITENLIRLSVGIEGIEDILEDLENAFKNV
jgi:cystathionine gamma-lyase